jgi:hypothetical protein
VRGASEPLAASTVLVFDQLVRRRHRQEHNGSCW